VRVERRLGLITLTALLLSGLPAPATAQTEWPNCENLLDQDDAQVTYDADRSDPFDLESTEPVNDVPCEDEPAFGTEPLISCDALSQYPDAQQALQGLYDHTRDDGDPYGLDQGGDPAVACDGGGNGADVQDPLDGTPRERRGNDDEALDGPPADRNRRDRSAEDEALPATSSGTTVIVSATPLGDFASLEERLDARFAALEADFAAFEARAQNGFGRFDESADDASSREQGASVIVSSSRQPAAVTQSEDTTDAGSQAILAQRARDGETIGAHPADRLKARNETKRERDTERKAKQRDRHNGKHRPRR
jgi:hypothetical protein